MNLNNNCSTMTSTTTNTSPNYVDASAKSISIAWHNLYYDNGEITGTDHKKNRLKSLKNLLLAHRRGSIPTPITSTTNQQQFPILRRLTGFFHYHTVNALLGPSSHARLTLIQCLTGFGSSSGLSKDSKIYINESEQRPTVAWIPGNLNQTIVTQMTIEEIFNYAYLFKNGFFQKQNQVDQHIKMMLNVMMLSEDILRRKFNQCSLCEQRCVAIAQELMCLKMPTFIFLEEPFVDLDLHSSKIVMQSLRQLVIHYPLTIVISAIGTNSHLNSLFDKFYILAHGGVCIYSNSPKLIPEVSQDQDSCNDIAENPKESLIEDILKISCHGLYLIKLFIYFIYILIFLEFTNIKVRKLADQILVDEHGQLAPHLDQLRFYPNGILISGKSFSIGDFLLQLKRLFYLMYINRCFAIRFFVTIVYYLFLSTIFISNNNNDGMINSNHINTCFDQRTKRLIESNVTCAQVINEQFQMDSYATYQMYSLWYLASLSICSTALFCNKILHVFQNEHQNRKCFKVY